MHRNSMTCITFNKPFYLPWIRIATITGLLSMTNINLIKQIWHIVTFCDNCSYENIFSLQKTLSVNNSFLTQQLFHNNPTSIFSRIDDRLLYLHAIDYNRMIMIMIGKETFNFDLSRYFCDSNSLRLYGRSDTRFRSLNNL